MISKTQIRTCLANVNTLFQARRKPPESSSGIAASNLTFFLACHHIILQQRSEIMPDVHQGGLSLVYTLALESSPPARSRCFLRMELRFSVAVIESHDIYIPIDVRARALDQSSSCSTVLHPHAPAVDVTHPRRRKGCTSSRLYCREYHAELYAHASQSVLESGLGLGVGTVLHWVYLTLSRAVCSRVFARHA